MSSNIKLVTWPEVRDQHERLEKQIRQIFYLCSNRKEFISEDEKQLFYEKWTKYYFDFWPEDIWLALANDDSRVLGYLMGCRNSKEAVEPFSVGVPSYKAFADLYEKFNCHLHINCHPDAQDMGIGTILIQKYIEVTRTANNTGLHVITAPKAKNRSFYLKNGFAHEDTRHWKGYPFLFMGLEY